MSDLHRLSCKDVRLEIAGKLLCKDLSLDIEPGQSWAVLGLNGTGKTTLLHTLTGIRYAEHGQVILDDVTLTDIPRHEVARHLGLLLQSDQTPFPGKVIEYVMIGRHPHLKALQWESDQDQQIALDALEKVGLDGFADRELSSLSGGEYQRMRIAMLLVQQPSIYLLDEPVNHLDWQHQHKILQFLTSMTKEHTYSLVMALHDVNLAARYCSHTLLMFDDGSIQAGLTSTLLNPEVLEELYHTPVTQIDSKQGMLFTPDTV